jgi:hypothetical protein
LIGHYVAYRKLISHSPSNLLPADRFRMYAVTARFPHNLAGQVPWQQRQAGVYDCHWGLDVVRVLVAGQLPREAHNAPLHLFSASAQLVDFAGTAYQRRSEYTSSLLEQLFEGLQREGITMPYTLADFRRDYVKEHFAKLTPEERAELLQSLPPERQVELLQSLPLEKRLAGLSEDQIRQYLERLTDRRPRTPRKPRRKK